MTPEQAQEALDALASLQDLITGLQTMVGVVGFFSAFSLAAYVFWYTVFRE